MRTANYKTICPVSNLETPNDALYQGKALGIL